MPEAAQLPTVFRFGPFEVDLRAGELRKQGLKVKLQERPLQILVLLLGHPGEVVTRGELRRQLWPADTFVDFDHSVNTAINKLRDALGDSAENPRFIETLPRHGYRFIGANSGGEAQVSREGTMRPECQKKGRWLAVSAVVAVGGIVVLGAVFALNVAGVRSRLLSSARASHGAPFPKIESIAVLPLENLSGDPTQEYFADGMTEELITHLGTIGALRVISRTSVMHYKRTKRTLPEIARELNVDAIVEGTVQHSGDRVRITANLLYAPNDRLLWAQTYERDLRDVLSLQDEVARAIASQIRIRLTPQEHARLAGSRPVNPEAYHLYLQGRYYFFKRTLPAFHKSIELFQRALERDPYSALVYAGLSESYAILPFYGGALPREVFPKAKEAALKALAIDNNLAEAHAALGFCLLWYDWDWSAAESELKHAIELKPSYAVAHHWYAEYLTAMGRHNQAIAEITRAQELDPVSPLLRTIGGEIYSYARRYNEAIEQCRKGLELDPNFGLAHKWLGIAYWRKGMYQEALTELEEANRLTGRRNRLLLARVYATAGRRVEAMKLLDRFSGKSTRGEVSPQAIAAVYVTFGDEQRALEWLQKAYEDRDPFIVFTKVDPALDPLRSDPRFQAILRRMNFPP